MAVEKHNKYSTVRMKSDKPRSERDFYPTPYGLAKQALFRLNFDESFRVIDSHSFLDPGAGNGVWGNAIREVFPNPSITGIDLVGEKPVGYNYWNTCDYLDYVVSKDFPFHFVVGNPPFSLAEKFIRHSLESVCDGGYVFFLLRLAFLEGRQRQLGLFNEFPLKRCYVLTRRPSFFSTKVGRDTTDTLAYAMFLWQKGWDGVTELDWLYWENK